MACNLHAIEQMQLRGRRRVDGVGHPKFDFHTANTAWAFATASHRAPRLLDAVAREAARRADEFKPQELVRFPSLIFCSLHNHRRTRPGPSPPVAEMTLLTPKYKGSSSTTSRGRPINDWTASPIKGYRILLGRSRPPARPNGTKNSSAPSRAKRRRAWPSSSPRASRTWLGA